MLLREKGEQMNVEEMERQINEAFDKARAEQEKIILEKINDVPISE